MEQTLKKQSVGRSRTVIKVKNTDSECEIKSAVQVLSVNVEDSLSSSSGLRRSSRKRLSSSGFGDFGGNKTSKRYCSQAVDIQEPLDMVTQINFQVKEKCSSHGDNFAGLENADDLGGATINNVANVNDEKLLRPKGSAVSDLIVEKGKVYTKSGIDNNIGNEVSIQSKESDDLLAVPRVRVDIRKIDVNENMLRKEIGSKKVVQKAFSVDEVSSTDRDYSVVQDLNNNVSRNGKEQNEEEPSVLNEFIQIASDSVGIDTNRRLKDYEVFTGATMDKEETPSKVFSDDFSDSCIVKCGVCDKNMYAHRLRSHTATQHNLPISQYKEQFGSQPILVKTTYHHCKLCGKEILLDLDSVASHVRTSHKVSTKDYNSKYMILKRKAVDNADDKSVVNNVSSALANVKAKHVKEIEKVDYQWYDANTFTCNICQFASSNLKVFKKHVKREHTTCLSKFDASYSSTDVF